MDETEAALASVDRIVEDLLQLIDHKGNDLPDGTPDPAPLFKRSAIAETVAFGLGFDNTNAIDAATVQRFLRGMVRDKADDTAPPEKSGKKSLTAANMIQIVGRSIRLDARSPRNLGRRKDFAVEGMNQGVHIFKHDRRSTHLRKYCTVFATELRRYAVEQRSLAPRESLRSLRGDQGSPSGSEARVTARLIRLSRQLHEDLDRVGTSSRADIDHVNRLSAGVYVHRSIEDDLLHKMAEKACTIFLVGDAGHGKSCMLWSLYRQFDTSAGTTPLLLSAAWFQADATGLSIVDSDDVISVASMVDGQPVVLLDTADLLLHSARTRVDMIDLLNRLRGLGVATIVATRPREFASLPEKLGEMRSLGSYSDPELDQAVRNLTEVNCAAEHRPDDPVAAVRSARARGLLVDEVSRSPLLLRLLFETSTPLFPSLEVDVTGLYKRYWSRRIVRDVRSESLELGEQATENLGPHAGCLGIAMVALGSPEGPTAAITRHAAMVSDGGQRILAAERIRTDEAVAILERRGVVQVSHEHLRFLHQTLFEFAAANGLAARGGHREVARLQQRVVEAPDDMFVGAILEQLLIVLGEDAIAKPTVIDCLRHLLTARHSSLTDIAMVVWAHHPDCAPLNIEEISALPADALRRFAQIAPTVHASDVQLLLGQLQAIWKSGRKVWPMVLVAVEMLARRDASATAVAVRRADYIGELARTNVDALRGQLTTLTILKLLTPVDPLFVRDAVPVIVTALAGDGKGKEMAARYLQFVAHEWAVLGTAAFLTDLALTIASVQDRTGDSDAILMRQSLAAVWVAEWKATLSQIRPNEAQGYWQDLVSAVCRDLVANHQDGVAGAKLIAISRVVSEMEPEDPRISTTIDQLFAMRAIGAPYQLGRGAVAELLSAPTPAREVLIARLAGCLEHLPAEQHTDVPGPKQWAAVARLCLTDKRVPPPVVARVIGALSTPQAPSLWLDRFGLLALLPAASVAQVPGAGALFDAITNDPDQLPSPADKNVFVDNCVERITDDPARILPGLVAVSASVRRPGPIKKLIAHQAIPMHLRASEPQLLDFTSQLLRGGNGDQSRGADLLCAAISAEIMKSDYDTLLEWFSRVRDPAAKASLIKAIVETVREHDDDRVRALQFFASTLDARRPVLRARERAGRVNPLVLDAMRDGWLELLAFTDDTTVCDWAIAFNLAFAPRLLGKRQVDITGFGNASVVLSRLVANHQVSDAVEGLLEVTTAFVERGLTEHQQRNGANRFRVSVRSVIAAAGVDELRSLIEAARSTAPTLGALIVHAAYQERRSVARAHLQALRQQSDLDGGSLARSTRICATISDSVGMRHSRRCSTLRVSFACPVRARSAVASKGAPCHGPPQSRRRSHCHACAGCCWHDEASCASTRACAKESASHRDPRGSPERPRGLIGPETLSVLCPAAARLYVGIVRSLSRSA